MQKLAFQGFFGFLKLRLPTSVYCGTEDATEDLEFFLQNFMVFILNTM